jgi:hypothetical protein
MKLKDIDKERVRAVYQIDNFDRVLLPTLRRLVINGEDAKEIRERVEEWRKQYNIK